MSYHGIVTDMLPSSGSRNTALSANTALRRSPSGAQQATFMSSLDQGNQEQATAIDAAPLRNDTQAQTSMTGSSSGSSDQTMYNEVESRSSQELKVTHNQPTRERSMPTNFASRVDIAAYQKPATTSKSSGSYRFISFVSPKVAPKTEVSPATLAALRSVPKEMLETPVSLPPDYVPPDVNAPPVVVEEPWYKTPTGMAVAGIGILALLAGGYALYKSQGALCRTTGLTSTSPSRLPPRGAELRPLTRGRPLPAREGEASTGGPSALGTDPSPRSPTSANWTTPSSAATVLVAGGSLGLPTCAATRQDLLRLLLLRALRLRSLSTRLLSISPKPLPPLFSRRQRRSLLPSRRSRHGSVSWRSLLPSRRSRHGSVSWRSPPKRLLLLSRIPSRRRTRRCSTWPGGLACSSWSELEFTSQKGKADVVPRSARNLSTF